MKKINLLLILFLVQLTLIAQRNPLDEVLVYFSSGVTQTVGIEKGSQKKVAKISSDSLKKYLQNIGIVESMLKVAMPSFNRKDTLTILSDNTKLRQIDMSKLYRINLSKGMSKDSIIYLLNKLHNVVYAEPNTIVNTCSTYPS